MLCTSLGSERNGDTSDTLGRVLVRWGHRGPGMDSAQLGPSVVQPLQEGLWPQELGRQCCFDREHGSPWLEAQRPAILSLQPFSTPNAQCSVPPAPAVPSRGWAGRRAEWSVCPGTAPALLVQPHLLMKKQLREEPRSEPRNSGFYPGGISSAPELGVRWQCGVIW